MERKTRLTIDPALGLDLVAERTLRRRDSSVSVIIPAHNEQDTVTEVVEQSFVALGMMGVDGEIIVSASACSDATAERAREAGAHVVETGAGKGTALNAGVAASRGEILCLIDGDFRYYGREPIAAALCAPILYGTADITISDLYWRPLYPQLWFYGFFAPLAGYLYPELLAKVGTTPWSGQRATLREYWTTDLPSGFTVDLALLLHWNTTPARMRPIIADDWTNPQRPKPDLIHQEFELLSDEAVKDGRLDRAALPALRSWFDAAHGMMSRYRPDIDDPQEFEHNLLNWSTVELHETVRVLCH